MSRFSADNIVFSTACIRKYDKSLQIEMLVHPTEHLFVVRPAKKETKNAVRWAKLGEDLYYPRTISCAAFIKTLYTLFGWKLSCKYRVRGVYRKKGNESVLIFDMRDTEIFIPQETVNSNNKMGR